MALLSYAWISLAQVKTHLGITSTGNDAELTMLVNGATDFIEHQLGGRRLLASTGAVTEIQDGGDGYKTRVLLNQYPVSTGNFTSFKYNNGTISTPNWVAFQTDDYTLYTTQGVLKVFGGLPEGSRNIQIVYKGGYSTGTTGTYPIPQDLVLLAIKMVSRIYTKRKSDGIKSEAIGTASITWDTTLDDFDKKALASYKRVIIT